MTDRLRLSLALSTPISRNEAIPLVQSRCQQKEVTVRDVRVFLNVALALQLESRCARLLELIDSLIELGFQVSESARREFDVLRSQPPEALATGCLHLSFAEP